MARVVAKSDEVWHYTTTSGLQSILSSASLWASSAAMLNDTSELGLGRSVLRELLASNTEVTETIQARALALLNQNTDALVSYIVSASRDGDSLTLWRNYGGSEVAYAIKLDRTRTLVPVEQLAGESHPMPPPGYPLITASLIDDVGVEIVEDPDDPWSNGGRWRKIDYIAGPTDKLVSAELEKLIKDVSSPPKSPSSVFSIYNWTSVDSPTVYWKHAGFRDEREVRAAWRVGPSWKFVKYRAGRFGFVPFIEVAVPLGNGGKAPNYLKGHERRSLPITDIRIGPTRFPDDAERALRMLLDDTGYGHVTIHRSETPFR